MTASRLAAFAALTALAFSTCVAPAMAAEAGPAVLRDTEAETLLKRIAAPMAASAGLAPGALEIVIVNDPEVNAFVAGGQTIYVNSGLLLAATDVGEVEGVLAHELGHIEAGDAVRDGAGRDNGHIMMLSVLAGVVATALGAGTAGMAAIMAGEQGVGAHQLAYSRQVEGSADASAVRHLADAHYSGRGMIAFYGKLRHIEYRLTPAVDAVNPYMQSHPMTADRQAMLSVDLAKSPWWNTPNNSADQAAFLRIKAKLFGFISGEETTLKTYPLTDTSQPARYARAYAWYQGGQPERAKTEIASLVATAPNDPYYAELQGQILLGAGDPRAAIAPLRVAVERSGDAPLITALLGQALLATDERTNLPEALRVLKLSVGRDRRDPDAWRSLGTVYAAMGDEARASLAAAEGFACQGDLKDAKVNAAVALRNLKTGTPDWLRAQDIAVTAG